VFERAGTTWTQTAKLVPTGPQTGDRFGQSLALEADTLFVGSPEDDDFGNSSGSVYVFAKQAGIWTEATKLNAFDASAASRFGVAVTLNGDLGLVGASGADAAYVFNRSGSTWSPGSRLSAAGTRFFGASLSLGADTAVVGAPGTNVGGMDRGEVAVFSRLGTEWVLARRLGSPVPTTFSFFGAAVSLSDEFLLAGAPQASALPGFEGSVRAFTLARCVPGTPQCAGTGCPCANDDGSAGCVNSSGEGARLLGAGSASIAEGTLVLSATNCPRDNTGLFLASDTLVAPLPLGDGNTCMAGNTFRYPAGVVDNGGAFALSDPIGAAPPGFIMPGVTRHFQAWTRDVLCGPPPSPCSTPCSGASNLTNSYSVTFEP
jgi:hypothetical protein